MGKTKDSWEYSDPSLQSKDAGDGPTTYLKLLTKFQTRMSKVTGAAEKTEKSAEGASGPCGPGEFLSPTR